MPARPRRTPAPVTGTARRVEEPDALAAPTTPPVPTPTARKTASQTARGSRPAPSQSTEPDAATAAAPVDEGEGSPAAGGEQPKRKTIQRTFHVDLEILEAARAAVTWLAAFNPESGIRSLTDLVNPGLAEQTKVLQDRYNDGKPFRRVAAMQSGRPRRS